jgi:hypothetical protein
MYIDYYGSTEPIFDTNVRMMLDTFFIAAEAFDIITVQLPVVDIESRMGNKAIGSSGKALGI